MVSRGPSALLPAGSSASTRKVYSRPGSRPAAPSQRCLPRRSPSQCAGRRPIDKPGTCRSTARAGQDAKPRQRCRRRFLLQPERIRAPIGFEIAILEKLVHGNGYAGGNDHLIQVDLFPRPAQFVPDAYQRLGLLEFRRDTHLETEVCPAADTLAVTTQEEQPALLKGGPGGPVEANLTGVVQGRKWPGAINTPILLGTIQGYIFGRQGGAPRGTRHLGSTGSHGVE